MFSGQTFYIFPTERDVEVMDLIQLITDHGGVVFDYHRKGYYKNDPALKQGHGIVLVDPSQPYAPELFQRRVRVNEAQNTRLEYVNWGYIRFSLDTNEVLSVDEAMDSLVFNRTAESNGGWRIHLSPKLGFSEQRFEKIKEQITLRGGQIVEDKEEADIIILPDDPDILEEGRTNYRGNPETRVESYRWLVETIKRQYIKFTPPEIKFMPGTPVLKRTPFTEQEREHLVRYMGAHCHPSGSGRMGHNLYIKMCEEKEWAKAHPWRSWREQYKKNSKKFDEDIYKWQKAHPAKFADGHGRDTRRNPPGRRRIQAKRLVRKADMYQSDVEEEDEGDASRDEQRTRPTFPPSRKRRQPDISSEDEQPPASADEEELQDYGIGGDEVGMDTGEQFDEVLDAMPKSTPPRVEAVPPSKRMKYSTGDDVSRTLVGRPSSAVPSFSRNQRSTPQPQSSRAGPAASTAKSEQYYGIVSDLDEPDEEDEDWEEKLVREAKSSTDDHYSGSSRPAGLPPNLDQQSVRKSLAKKSRGSLKAYPTTHQDEEEEAREEATIPARTFKRVNRLKAESSPTFKLSKAGQKYSSNLLKRRGGDS